MTKISSLTMSLKATFLCAAITVCLSGMASISALASPTKSSGPHVAVNGGLIFDGPSRVECLAPNVNGSGLSALQSAVTKFDTVTGTSVTCLSAYLNGAQSWSAWEQPWITQTQYGYTSWVAEAPQSRELVVQVDLIPNSLRDTKDPLTWERSCAAGNFDSHATQLGTSLVAAGLQHSVIRLGAEMNGDWEADFVGTTTVEQQLWVNCFKNEVRSLRQATGGHFLIDWDPNPCSFNIPYANLYPGNSFVNILGIDLFDVSCAAPKTPISFAQLESQPSGLTSFEALARAHHKPLSLPEWGLLKKPSGDDPGFIDGIGSTFTSRDFAFETYFDVVGSSGGVLPLGSRTPLSLPAFQRWFSSDEKH